MGTKTKFNFIPENRLYNNAGADSQYLVSIYSKPIPNKIGEGGIASYSTNLIFTKKTADAHNLRNKLVRFYGDQEKKMIGWSIVDDSENVGEFEGVRQFILNSADICTFGITKLLKKIGVEIKERRSGIPVFVYTSSPESRPIYYIKL